MPPSRAAVVVGIDNYANFSPLAGCVNDANAVRSLLSRNEDNSPNFDVRYLTSAMGMPSVSAEVIRTNLESLFGNRDVETALFYFAGHGGLLSGAQGHLCTSDGTGGMPGIALNQVLGIAN